ncbi:hypothetical protein SLS60_007917 [Paraconiothyrium brasiliense]|uniref:DUF4045 domain-containing protein n=1 Tax=Paraconiothyrium brasiliense TaxID=300254 RepID=A0ABR3R2V5_9PLEO
MSNPDEVDPRQFLERMRTLSDQRDQQDAERVKKLEEELIQGRSERLARRAERARSLSPDKPTTPQSLRSLADTPRTVQEKLADMPTPDMEPPLPEQSRDDSLQQLTGSPAQLIDDTEPKKPIPSAAALGRSGTLSWQQRRPQSGSIRRPISVALSPSDKANASSPRNSEPTSPERPTSRTQIAQSLGAKDPSWFKQTADRGIGSAAYRKEQEDNVSEVGSIYGKQQLPGMSRDSTAESGATSPPLESPRSSGSIRSNALLGNRISATASLSGVDEESIIKTKSPLPVRDAQKFAPPSDGLSSVDGSDRASTRSLAMSPTQGRISPERPVSPTKGMGGFVQSAIMKRSDSVSKRWSAQAPPTLSRQNSSFSNRGSTYGTLPRSDTRPTTLSRDNSIEPSSRPSSSAGVGGIIKDATDSAQKPEFAKPALPRHSRSKSVASTFSEGQAPQDETSPPSPSKRWSPTKSSWLESALNKPESPKPQQPPPQQPAWMSEINRIKQQRGSVDLGKVSPLKSQPADSSTASGRSSPIKEVQLRPVSLRSRPETPRKEEPPVLENPTEALQSVREKPGSPNKESSEAEDAKPAHPSPRPKPVVAAKPSVPANDDSNTNATNESVSPNAEPEIPKSPSVTTGTKPTISSSRFTKDPALSPAAVKSKPDTPPKKDFRATLKSRQPVAGTTKNEEVNELQNVFGKLRRTETKNYVAPDTFKNNIVQGKNALNITGGPKPSVRRNEFRDSLVSQKAAMLAKAQETGSAAHQKTDSSASAKNAPPSEVIAARMNLGRSDSISKPPPPPPKETGVTPEAIARRKSLRASKPPIVEKSTAPFVNKEASSMRSSKLADRFNPALANMLARGPPPMAGSGGTAKEDVRENPAKPSQEERIGPAPELTHMTKGRARGPRRRAPGTKQNESKSTDTPQKAKTENVALLAQVPLVKTEQVLPSSGPSSDAPVHQTPVRNLSKDKPITPAKSPDLPKRISQPPTPEPPKKPASLELKREVSSEAQVIPQKSPFTVAAQSPKHVSSPSYSSFKPPSILPSRPLPTAPSKPAGQPLKEIALPNTDSARKEEQSPDKPAFTVKSATAIWSSQITSSSPIPSKPKSPIKLPTRADEKAAMEGAGLNSPTEAPEPLESKPLATKPKPAGLGLGSLGSFGGLVASRSRESTPAEPYSVKISPTSPPMVSNRPQSEPFKESPAREKPASVFTDFFDEPPVTTGVLPESIDTVRILKTTPYDLSPNGKIRTTRKQIHEVTGDGKLTPIHAHDEHVLFQDSMYLCIHTFANAGGSKTTEIYLWAGNGVAEPTIEDVQLFAKNYAKQNQGTLVPIRQGKETPNFLDALGGIIITRRGAFPPAKEYMLCGRRHLGRLVFDEVDFALKSLCSGYAYIITTSRGKVYLWKGRGCCAEELAGARLMGMDLAPGGDFLEIDEGVEPDEMIQMFPPSVGKGPAIPRSADHWRYKTSSERYQTRLFKVEQQQSSGWGSLQVSSYLPAMLRRPSWQFNRRMSTEREQTPSPPKSPLPPGMSTKIVEIMPFCQRDLEPEHIYVLDAFFEMYIIVGSLSRSQHHAFSTALMFAQEYVILAVTEEDRPIKPPTTILLEGVPRDMRAVFRHWDESILPAAGLMNGKLGRGKSLRIVSMEKAIEATRQR